MCQTHIGGKSIIPINIIGHVCLYLLIPSPGYSKISPITSLHKESVSIVPASHFMIFYCYTQILPPTQDHNQQLPVQPPRIYLHMRFTGFVPRYPLYLTSILPTDYNLHSFYGHSQWQRNFFV